MKNVFLLAWANIRKGKGQTASLLAFVLIAALLLNLGLLLMLNYSSYFDRHYAPQNPPSFMASYDATPAGGGTESRL
jgi:hypothetical protein